MHRSGQNPKSPRRRQAGLLVAVAASIFALAAVLAAIAIASSGALTVSAARNAQLGEIAVNAKGRTLYALSPETTRHLLCKGRECFKFWPPLTVRSRRTKLKAGAGVHGRLGILHRKDGMLQVTLGGLPLYRYAGDHARGDVNGQHIHSFGGVWHVIAAGSGTMRTSSTASGSSSTTQTWPGTSSTATSSGTSTTPPTSTTTTSTSSTTTTTTTPYKYPPPY